MKKTENLYTIPERTPELEHGPDWLKQHRHQSRETFNNSPLPRRGLHLWRYTNPADLVPGPATETVTTNERFELVYKSAKDQFAGGRLSGLVTDLGGREINIAISEQAIKQGVIIASLAEAVESHRELVEPYLYGLVGNENGKFEAMNSAVWHDGIFIHVPDGVTVEQPIHLLRESGGAGTSQYPRLLAVVGRNAELTMIDEYGGGSSVEAEQSFTNGAVEIYGLEDSRTRYISLQRLDRASRLYHTHRAKIAQGAQILTIPLAFGGAMAKQNFGVILNGAGAESRIYGLVFGSGHQHFDNHTLHHHAAGQTQSHIDLKVVMRDHANSAYTGLIRIEQAAASCEAYQENRNLLLNSGAHAETIPELEILNEDVSCSHGATIGPIDPALEFYLHSRGIEPAEAVKMIVAGYVATTLNKVPSDLRERVTQFVADRLENL